MSTLMLLCHTGTGSFSKLPHSCIHLRTESTGLRVLKSLKSSEEDRVQFAGRASFRGTCAIIHDQIVGEEEAVLIHQDHLDYWFLHYCFYTSFRLVSFRLWFWILTGNILVAQNFELSISDYKGTLQLARPEMIFCALVYMPSPFQGRQWK